MLKSIKSYIGENLLISAVILYIILSALLHILTGIDIYIPCIWKTIFKVNCPGCGLTTAFTKLLRLNFRGAIEANRLIVVVLPIAICSIIVDFEKHKRREHAQKD